MVEGLFCPNWVILKVIKPGVNFANILLILSLLHHRILQLSIVHSPNTPNFLFQSIFTQLLFLLQALLYQIMAQMQADLNLLTSPMHASNMTTVERNSINPKTQTYTLHFVHFAQYCIA